MSEKTKNAKPKRWRSRMLLIIGVVGAAIFGGLHIPELQDYVVRNAITSQLSIDRTPLYAGDAMRVVFCGTAAPPPSPGRAKSCTLVIAGKHSFIVDSGPKSTENLMRWRMPIARTTAVLITHFHSDHIGELGELAMNAWAGGRTQALPVWGPDGIERVVSGFNEAYAFDTIVRRKHHSSILGEGGGLTAMPFGLADAESRVAHNGAKIIFDQDGLKITAFQVVHEPVYPAVGYRFDYRGRSIVITGDAVVSTNLADQTKGVDVLISESQSEPMRAMMVEAAKAAKQRHVAQLITDVKSYHLTPVQAAKLADDARVKALVFTHFGPNAPSNWLTRQIYLRGVKRVGGPIHLADDGSMLSLPVNNEAVLWDRIE
jgi:ribonuclease Z